MKYIKYILIALAFFLPTVAAAATYGVGWQATTTTNGLIVPNTLNGTVQRPYIDSFFTSNTAATSTVVGNFLISPTGSFPKGFTSGTNFAMYDSYVGPFQSTVVNGSNSNFAIASTFVGNDKYTAAEFASTYYCGLVMGSSNYFIPGFNGLKANGGALFCKDGSLTVGTGTSTAGTKIYFNAGGLDDNQVSGVIDAVTDNWGIGPTTTPTSLLAIHAYPQSTRTSLFSIASSTPTATTTLLNFTRDGRMGIGTSTPRGKLNIYDGPSGVGSTAVFYVENSGSSGGSYVAQMSSGTGTVNGYPSFSLTNAGSTILNSQSQFLGYGTNIGFTGSGGSNGRGQLVIVYGAGGTTWGNFFVDSGGQMNIGSSATTTIMKTAGGRTSIFSVASSTSGLATSTAFNVSFDGNTSVGTTSNGGGVSSQLYVQNVNNNTAIVNFASQTGSSRLTVSDAGAMTLSSTITADGNNLVLSQSGLTSSAGTKIRLGALTTDGVMFHRVNNNNLALVNSNGTQGMGNFGIGTSTPWASFSLATSSRVLGGAPFFAIASTTGTSATSTIMLLDAQGELGIGLENPTQMLVVNGGLQASTTKTKPTCDNTVRGTFWATQSGAGVKDAVEVCAKDAADAYAWRTIY